MRKIFTLPELDYIPEKGMFRVPDQFWPEHHYWCAIVFRWPLLVERCV